MANHNLSPRQGLLLRRLYHEIACNEANFPQDPVGQRNFKATIMRLLGYDKPKAKTYRFGHVPPRDISVEWQEDEQRERAALEEVNEANTSESVHEADSSEPTESPEVREAVLREDV